MHPYSTNSEERRDIVFTLAVISVGCIYLLNLLLNYFEYYIPFELQPPSAATIFGLLFIIFNKYCWKWSVFRKISIINIPNINGTWNVTAKSSYGEGTNNTIASATINQTWTKISIKLEFEESRSFSTSGSILLDTFEGDIITYTYLNKPKVDAPESMKIHEGTTKLIITDSTLEGDYYSGKHRGNYGSITFS